MSKPEGLETNIKKPFKTGGQWGDRLEKINELIEKMIWFVFIKYKKN